jgi:hypothetical protein
MDIIKSLHTQFTEKTFDITTAMAFMLLWVMFAYTTPLLSCDTQRIMESNIYAKHSMGLIGFFLLMTLTDPKNNANVGIVWLKSIIGYLFFMVIMKNEITAFIIILVLLAGDLTLRTHIDYKKKNDDLENIEMYEKARTIIFYSIIIVSLIGVSLYGYHAYEDHKENFSLSTFIIGNNKCDK